MSAKWRAWVSAALACSAVAVYPTTEQLAATRQQASPSPQPWLGTSVDLVLVDLRVTRDGEAVSDVRQDELTLFVDGTPRPLVSLVYAPVTRPPQLEGDLASQARHQLRLLVVTAKPSLAVSL